MKVELTTLALLLLVSGCGDGTAASSADAAVVDATVVDAAVADAAVPVDEAPSVPDDSLSITSSGPGELTVTWSAAMDAETSTDRLEYQVRHSSSDDISTVTSAFDHGAVALPFTADVTSTVISGLPAGPHYVNVFVRDAAGNRVAYQSTAADVPDFTPPLIPSPSVALGLTIDTTANFTVSFAPAQDDVTEAQEIEYQALYVISDQNTMTTVADAEANGTIGRDYATNIPAQFSTNTGGHYWVTVLARDQAGNRSIYGAAQTYVCFLPETLITMADGSEKRIDEIESGERVMSFDDSGDLTTSAVEKVLSLRSREYLVVETERGSVRVTPWHPFLTESGLFEPIGHFQVGDRLTYEDDGELHTTTIVSMEHHEEEVAVFNLHNTDGPSTYFANGFAVHNK